VASFRFQLAEPAGGVADAEVDVRDSKGYRLDHIPGDPWAFDAPADSSVSVGGGVFPIAGRNHLAASSLGMHRYVVTGRETDAVTFTAPTSEGDLTFRGWGLVPAPPGVVLPSR
jgi:hypothetical protein